MWSLHSLIRSMGAYFVRRNSGDALHREVLQRHVQMATEGDVPQALYPQGWLSMDGKLRAPKLGLLDYMLQSFNPHAARDLVFIPVGINYDRVLKDRTLLRILGSALPPRGLSGMPGVTLLFCANNLWLRVTGRWCRYGYACVNFGRSISMRPWRS
jgi:glycerol-3-phosphate O-acyltransferase